MTAIDWVFCAAFAALIWSTTSLIKQLAAADWDAETAAQFERHWAALMAAAMFIAICTWGAF